MHNEDDMKRKRLEPSTKGDVDRFATKRDFAELAIKGSESRMTARMDPFMSNTMTA